MVPPQILVLDDEEWIRSLLGVILARSGYACLEAGTDEEAVRVLESNHVDLVMEDMLREATDGIQFLRFLKSNPRFNRIPVLMVAGMSQVQAEKWFAQAGFGFENLDGFFRKPFNVDQLLAKVHEILTRTGTWYRELENRLGMTVGQICMEAAEISQLAQRYNLTRRSVQLLSNVARDRGLDFEEYYRRWKRGLVSLPKDHEWAEAHVLEGRILTNKEMDYLCVWSKRNEVRGQA